MTTRIKNYLYILTIAAFCYTGSGCKKYLDAKPSKTDVIPETLEDMQALLDYYSKMNQSDGSAAEISCDNYYLADADFNGSSIADNQKRIHTWEEDNLFPNYSASPGDWRANYDIVYVANTVLDNIDDKVTREASNQNQWDNVKGQALVFRAKAFQQLAFVFTPAYDPATAMNDLGLPLRLNSDFNESSVRSSVQETYDRIIADLKEAIPLLPVVPLNVLRPSKPAAYAFLARTYLAMRQYDKAGLYADSVLQLKDTLLDYNDPKITATGSSAAFANITFSTNPVNPEIIMQAHASFPTILANTRARMDPALYQSYSTDDKRKTVFFRSITTGVYGFRGNYTGGGNLFTGIATDEIYLIRAECYARAGNKDAAMNDLNRLMRKRWKNTVVYPDTTAADAPEALNKVLTERRKELVYRCLRWMDLKRLNKGGANITLIRIAGGQSYTLIPNDLRYALPIPEDVIAISGMPQNPR